ncbi:hypothetical protein MD484_g7599, partial [Candolleomyces efflorescens]
MARTAVITGAAQGIGKAIALRLVEDGCNVVLNDLPSQRVALEALVDEINRTGGAAPGKLGPAGGPKLVATCSLGDVTVEDDVKKMVELAMVANAGVVLWKTIFETSLEEFNRVLSINVKGTFLCIKYASEQMIKQGNGGRIIAASSVAGKKALELGASRITVNAYAPGPMQTPMLDSLDARAVTHDQLNPGEWLDNIRQANVFKELGKPQYVADAVSFLASDKGCFITGELSISSSNRVIANPRLYFEGRP